MRPHDLYERRGDELHCLVTVPMTAAALGTSVTLDTLDGPVAVDIRPGTQSGESVVVRGHGASRLRSAGRGDLHVHLSVQTPTALDARQEELLRQLAEMRAESTVQVGHAVEEQGGGFFSRIKDAFSSR